MSGHGPIKPDESYVFGKVPTECSQVDAYQAARLLGLNMLATLKAHIADLNRVQRLVKVFGMVRAAPSFDNHPSVINGFSDLMAENFGDAGRASLCNRNGFTTNEYPSRSRDGC